MKKLKKLLIVIIGKNVELQKKIILKVRLILIKKNDMIENLVRCSCGNKDQTRFVSYNHEGEIVCMGI